MINTHLGRHGYVSKEHAGDKRQDEVVKGVDKKAESDDLLLAVKGARLGQTFYAQIFEEAVGEVAQWVVGCSGQKLHESQWDQMAQGFLHWDGPIHQRRHVEHRPVQVAESCEQVSHWREKYEDAWKKV